MPRPWSKFVPRPLNWRWDIVSESFVRYQIARGEDSRQTCLMEQSKLGADVRAIQDRIVSNWSTAKVQEMRSYYHELTSIKKEWNAINRQLLVIEENLELMRKRGKQRGWKL
jgi:hypothetical protein